jgi:hypothetical protein
MPAFLAGLRFEAVTNAAARGCDVTKEIPMPSAVDGQHCHCEPECRKTHD